MLVSCGRFKLEGMPKFKMLCKMFMFFRIFMLFKMKTKAVGER